MPFPMLPDTNCTKFRLTAVAFHERIDGGRGIFVEIQIPIRCEVPMRCALSFQAALFGRAATGCWSFLRTGLPSAVACLAGLLGTLLVPSCALAAERAETARPQLVLRETLGSEEDVRPLVFMQTIGQTTDPPSDRHSAPRTVSRYRGVRPGQTTAEQLTNHPDWQAAFVEERKVGALVVRQYRLAPWASVLAILRDGTMSALDFIPPDNFAVSAEQLAEALHVGELAPAASLPESARFGIGEDPLPEMLSSASHYALFFLQKLDDGRAQVTRIRLYSLTAEAMYQLGRRYARGDGVDHDHAKAVRWYRAAADEGNVGAMYSLGVRYAEGRGVAQDDAEAVRWYRAAAEKGHVLAMYNLAILYAGGRGVARDKAEAIRWYRAAAEKGYASAMFNLGNMYAGGRGVARDEAEAIRWYRAAAKQGNESAQKNLKELGLTW